MIANDYDMGGSALAYDTCPLCGIVEVSIATGGATIARTASGALCQHSHQERVAAARAKALEVPDTPIGLLAAAYANAGDRGHARRGPIRRPRRREERREVA